MSEEYTDEEHEQVMDQGEVWYNEFEKSEFFNALSEAHRNEAGFVINSFTDYMYTYQGTTPQEWNPRDLDEVCLEILPRKISADKNYFEAVAPVLKAFFIFLNHQDYQKNAAKLAKTVAPLSEDIINNSSDPGNWGMAKSMVMLAQGEGIDLSDTKAMNQFFMDYNAKINRSLPKIPMPPGLLGSSTIQVRNTNKIGRNQSCPCNSGKKYKKCCGSMNEAQL